MTIFGHFIYQIEHILEKEVYLHYGNYTIKLTELLATILLAYGLKHLGIFKQEDGQVLSKMIVYITLPATIVNGVNGTKLTTLFLILAGIGLASNGIMILFAYFYGLKEKERNFRGLLLFTTGGYNIGNFAIPFVMAFFPSSIPYLECLTWEILSW